ncbi:MAG: hypothetical protein ACM3JK_02325 [Betaproteobacteria bacterium]
MAIPQTYFAYTPRGAGLMCAVVYIEVGNDVYGWWIGYQGGSFPSAFFRLGDFFSTRPTSFFATEGNDLYGGWKIDYTIDKPKLIDPPLPVEDGVSHELERMQDEFAAEWLFFDGDDGIDDEVGAYHGQDLPVLGANIKSRKLNKLDKGDVVWTYWSSDFDREILDFLMARWPLEYGK